MGGVCFNAALSCREWLLVSAAAAVAGVAAAAAAATLVQSRKGTSPCRAVEARDAVPARQGRVRFWKCVTRLFGSSEGRLSGVGEIQIEASQRLSSRVSGFECERSGECAADVFESEGGLGERCDEDGSLKALVKSCNDRIPGDPAVCNARDNADPSDPSKRKSYLSWDDYFMAIAFLSAERSKDPNRQVGACLVSQDRVILGIGYNGFPRGCSDDELPWAKISANGDPLQTKYPYVCHAEVNAILNKNHASAAGQRLYVTMFPCNECAKIIIQAGVAEVVYYIDKIRNTAPDSAYVASRRLLSLAGVKFWQHQQTTSRIVLEFS